MSASRCTRRRGCCAPGGHLVIYAPNRGFPFETHGVRWRGRYHFGNFPLVNYLPRVLRDRLVPHARVYTGRDLRRLWSGLPFRAIERTVVYPGFDGIRSRNEILGRALQATLHRAESTPMRVFGLSHFVILERRDDGEGEDAVVNRRRRAADPRVRERHEIIHRRRRRARGGQRGRDGTPPAGLGPGAGRGARPADAGGSGRRRLGRVPVVRRRPGGAGRHRRYTAGAGHEQGLRRGRARRRPPAVRVRRPAVGAAQPGPHRGCLGTSHQRHRGDGGRVVFREPRHQHARAEPGGLGKPGPGYGRFLRRLRRLLHHAAAGEERADPARGAQRPHDRAGAREAQGVDPGGGTDGAVLQAPDPGVVPEHDLLREPLLRDRGGGRALLRETRVGPRSARGGAAGRVAAGARPARPVRLPGGGEGAPAHRARPDGAQRLHHAGRGGIGGAAAAQLRQPRLQHRSAALRDLRRRGGAAAVRAGPHPPARDGDRLRRPADRRRAAHHDDARHGPAGAGRGDPAGRHRHLRGADGPRTTRRSSHSTPPPATSWRWSAAATSSAKTSTGRST